MAAPKGNRNNPNGRPPKSRALTAALEEALARPVVRDGATIPGKLALAGILTDVLLNGTAELPSGKVLNVAPKDWLEFAKWAYGHIDGPPKQEIEQSGALTIKVVYADTDAP